jgi:glycogen synthase
MGEMGGLALQTIFPRIVRFSPGGAGLLTQVESEDDLLHALRGVYTNAQLAGRFRRRASDRARSTYDIRSVATRYVGLYEQLRR